MAWKRANAELFLAVTNPDAWKNKKLVAFGSYAEGVTRANQLWMLDSTPADVQLLDGRHSILGVIDVATRRARLVVSKNSTAEAVCQLLRRAILDWGVPDTVKMDNGRDYASERVAGVLVGLVSTARRSCWRISRSSAYRPWLGSPPSTQSPASLLCTDENFMSCHGRPSRAQASCNVETFGSTSIASMHRREAK